MPNLKTGRPKGIAKPKQIVVRMTEQDYNAIKDKIEQSGKSQQEYITHALKTAKVVNTDGYKELAKQLKPIGVNLNQIARKLNEGNPMLMLLKDIEAEMRALWQLLRR